ncbi:hypothetical protein [Thiocapsa sp.]|uniref:hypothetical protein n=1 Tax=Thiocapsa sp. TaxID=2024551 RepID=UPI003593AF48
MLVFCRLALQRIEEGTKIPDLVDRESIQPADHAQCLYGGPIVQIGRLYGVAGPAVVKQGYLRDRPRFLPAIGPGVG